MSKAGRVSRRLIDRLGETLREERELRGSLAKVGRRAGQLLRHIAYRRVPQLVVARDVAPALGYANTIDELLDLSDALRARLARHRRAMAVLSPTGPGTPRPSRRARRR